MDKGTRNIIILSVLTLGAYGLYKLFSNKNEDENIQYVKGNKTTTVGSLIVSVPNTKLQSYPILYVFGGIDYANPQWMLSQTPSDILYKAIVVFAPYTSTFSSVKSETEKLLSRENLKTNSSSIVGFSAGGANVQKAYSNDFKFIGLIDPSTKSEYLSLPFKSNVSLVYNDSNWGGYPSIKSTLPKLDAKISSSGGSAEKVKLKHADIPKYFLDKFKNDIV